MAGSRTIARKLVSAYTAGCGTRLHGHAYLVTNVKKQLERYPFGYFVNDPPILIEDPSAWGLASIGLSYMFKDGVWHVKDWIGADNYPNFADIAEEFINGYASSLLPLNDGSKEHISLLTPGKSRRLLFHPHGWIDNFAEYRQNWVPLARWDECILPDSDFRRPDHLAGKEMCASLLWQVVEKGKVGENRQTMRKVGECEYWAVAPMADVKPLYRLAFNMWLPIDEVHVIDNEEIKDKSKVADALNFLVGLCSVPIFVTNR